MWLGKLSLKAAALVLVGAFSSMAANSSISPLTFGNDVPAQQEVKNWNYLTKFKLWGTTGIQFGNRPEFFDSRYYNKSGTGNYSGVNILDSLGWVGTAKGNLTSEGQKVSGWIDGPIIVGGSVSTQYEMTLVTGPIRTSTGSISCRHNGTTCQGDNQSGNCSYDKVPEIRSDLKVPTLSGVSLSGYKSLDLHKMDSQRRTVLDVSKGVQGQPGCTEKGVCDLFYSSIDFYDDNRLVIQMPKGGRIVRIFTGSMTLKNHPQIVVSYGDGDLKPAQYGGNLMVYVNSSISFRNTDNADFMGTYVVNGTITVASNMTIAGQFIANKIEIGDEFKSTSFVFKPFVVWPVLSILGNGAILFNESDSWQNINVSLSDEASENVSFDYCFEFEKNNAENGVNGVYAGYKDVGVADASHKFPICNKNESVKVTIPAGQKKATGINIKPLIDGLVENNEALWLQVNNLENAQLATDYETGLGYKIHIVSNDKLPTGNSSLAVNVNEDEKHTFTASEFKFQHSTQNFASVIITSLPAKGTIALNGTAITSGTNVAVANLGKLTYQAAANDFGNNYTSFKFKVVGDGAADNTSAEYTATVNVIPVNDKPSVADANFSVNEQEHTVTGGPIEVTDVSNERNKDTYTYTLVNVTGSDYAAFNSTFEIFKLSDQNATIKVKTGASLNYSVKKEYVVYATVKDNAATETSVVNGPLTSEQFKITVRIQNENDDPVIANQTFTIPEKNTDGTDWPSGHRVGLVVATDPDDDPDLSFSVVTSGVPFKFNNGTNELVVTDGSVLDFETKPTWTFTVKVEDGQGGDATAQITVELADVNEPPKPDKVKAEYSVKENSAVGTVVGTFVVKDYDKISGSLETLTYTLAGATNVTTTSMGDIFEVKETAPNGGEREVSILVKNKSLLDYETLYNGTNATYPVTITITDKGSHSVTVTTKIAVIDVNEEPWAKDGYFYVLEHSNAGTQVCVAYDADQKCTEYSPVNAGDKDLYNASFSELSYSINTTVSTENTQKMVDASKNFTINPTTGRIYTSSTANFVFDADCEKCNVYEFMVTVSDGEFSTNARIFVEVVDVEEPQVINYVTGTKKVPENSDETVIIDRFNKEDLSEEEQQKFNNLTNIAYTLEDISDPKFNDLFEISSKGTITPKEGVVLDFEDLYTGVATSPGNEVDIKILATEKNCSSCDKVHIVKHIAVTDVNEPSVFKEYGPYTVKEDLAEHGLVGFVVAEDPDSCSNVRPCRNGSHPSGFNSLQYFVDEVKEVDGSKDFPFEINQDNGEITLSKGGKLNYSKQKEYRCVVKVRDRSMDPDDPPITVKQEVVINVKDVNRAPEFKVLSDLYKVDELVDIGTVLVGDKIVVYDEDRADIDALTIAISEEDPGKVAAKDLFEVVKVVDTDASLQTTFVIKTKDDIDYEELYNTSLKDAVFDVTLTIKDTEGNTTAKKTQIRVNDKNEEPVVAKPDPFTIDENTTKATTLGKIVASDPDKFNPNFGTLYFSLEGADATQFDIDVSTGELSTINNAKFDYETKSTYKFKAVITDKEYTKKVDVVVNITNKSEPPTFSDKNPKLDVDENTSKGDKVTIVYVLKDGTKVGSIVADDDDCKGSFKSTCKLPTYSLAATDIAASDYKAFNIDNDGNITVAADNSLNYEKKKEYSVRIVATDGSDPTLSNYIDVVIKINDVNDAPTYEKKEYVFEIHENAPKGEFVGSVVADDEDTWSKLTFVLSDDPDGSTGDAATFEIDENGSIFLASKTLNYEKKDVYKVIATATDNGKEYGAKIGRTDFKNYEATTLVTIKIIDDPDTPVIKDDDKNYEVAENTVDNNTPDGYEIACYDVSDEDKGQVASLVAYVTDAGNTDADRLFGAKIKKDGSDYKLCLTVKNSDRLNYEAIQHVHKVFVAVMDADNLTAQVTKTINITDVNEMPIISGNTAISFYDQNKKDAIIAKLYSGDVDTSEVFTDNVFSAIGGDTESFGITEDGRIKAKREFDFQKEETHTFELVVALSDKDNKKYPKLTTSTKITITLKNRPKIPEITSSEFSVKENSDPGTFIGKIEADDPDGNGNLLFELTDESPYVIVTSDGEIKVKEGAVIDYEKMQQFTITVTVKDDDGLTSDKDIIIKVIDENEPPKIVPQEFTFPEDSKPGTKKGPIEADDPDTKNPKFNDLKFYPVGDNDKFEVKTNGDIVLKGELDYESEKSYVIKVYVTDGEFNDTTDITVNVGNVVERSDVQITRVDDGNSVYLNPSKEDTIFTNRDEILVEWKQDGKTKSSVDSLKEGCQEIVKKYKDASKDIAGADTITVCFSTAAPEVDVFASKTKVEADNIYTVLENVDKKDSTIYVNKENKEVNVSVKDSISGLKETYDVEVVLDTVAISDKVVKTLIDVSKSQPSLNKDPKSEVKKKAVNGEKTQVSYEETVNGNKVTISYNVDDKGDIIKVPVFDEDGKKTMVEVIEVSTVVEVKGKNVVVSYKAEAETGKILYGDSEGNLMYDVPSSSSVKKPTSSSSGNNDKSSSSSKKGTSESNDVDLKSGVGAFTVTYDANGVEGNKATVSYVIDEKGKIVANEEGDRGFLVTYTYTNRYGNSADKSVFMVLDKTTPLVIINSPVEGEVVYANYVDVDWCIAIDGDENNCVKQDTLNFQSLEKGVQKIKRIYRDKAGNEYVAEVSVMMKKAKDVNVELEKPMTVVSIDSVDKYYSVNPPKEDQSFAVSVLNPKTHKEREVVVGSDKSTSKGSGEEPYPGLDGHLGPTIKIDMKLPTVKEGLATLDDIIINGDMVPLDGVDADGSEKASVKDYVKNYCSDEFQEEYHKTKDFSKLELYSSSAHVTLWFYTTGGSFIDKYSFDYDVDDAQFVDKAGVVKLFYERKLDQNGELRDKNGRLFGTGPFIVKSKVDLRSKLRCTVPPVGEGNAKFGDVIKSSDELLTRFGYRRPVLHGNERPLYNNSKKNNSSNKSNKKSKK